MKSKGIDRNIDLTENRDFRDGVNDILESRQYSPGVLPWNKDGRPTVEYLLYRSRNSIVDDPIVEWTNIDSILNNNEFIYNTDYYTQLKIKNRYKEVYISEDPNDIYDYLSHYTDIYIKGDKLYLQYQDLDDMYNRCTYITYYDDTNDMHYFVNKINSEITPEKYKDVHLTDDEISGSKLITGNDLKIKYEKRMYLQQVQEILNNYKHTEKSLHNDEQKYCEICGNPIYNNIPKYSYSSTMCCECILEKYNSLIYSKPYRSFSRTGVYKDFHNIECRGVGHKYYQYDDTNDYYEEHDKVIDYFHQYRYEDRGVHLLRIPNGSHELRVNLGTGEFVDDEDEIRRSRQTYKLGYLHTRRYKNRLKFNYDLIDRFSIESNNITWTSL